MKERWGFSKEKLVSVEEGLKSAETVIRRRNCTSDCLIQYMKLVLYIELILFFGWSGYTLFRSNYPAFHDVKSPTVSTEELKLLILKDLKDTVDSMKTKENNPWEVKAIWPENLPIDDKLNVETTTKDNIIWFKWATTDSSAKLKDTLESKSDEDKEIIVKVPELDVSESKERESYNDEPVIEWGLPFFGHIHKETDPFKEDSSEPILVFEDTLRQPYESNEKDESKDVSEFRQTSLEKETTQQNEKEKSSSSSEDGPTSTEILNNLEEFYALLKAKRKDPRLDNFHEDDLSKSWKNSENDEESLFREESTKSSIVFPNESSEVETPWKSIESEKLDTLEEDETIDDSRFNFWSPPIFLQLSMPYIERENDEEAHDTDDSLVETVTETTNEENDGSISGTIWEPLFDSYNNGSQSFEIENVGSNSSTWDSSDEDYRSLSNSYTWGYAPAMAERMDDVDLDASTANTNEEDNSSVINRGWVPYLDVSHEFAKPLQKESVNEENESVQFGPSLKNEDFSNSLPCTIEYFNGVRVMKCSWSSADRDRSYHSSSITESNSESTTESSGAFFDKNHRFFDEFSSEEKVPDNTELSNEKSDTYYSSAIKKDSSEISDNPAKMTSEDSVVLPSPVFLNYPHEQTTASNDQDAYINKMKEEAFLPKWMHKSLDKGTPNFYPTVKDSSTDKQTLDEPYLQRHEWGDDYVSQDFSNKKSKTTFLYVPA